MNAALRTQAVILNDDEASEILSALATLEEESPSNASPIDEFQQGHGPNQIVSAVGGSTSRDVVEKTQFSIPPIAPFFHYKDYSSLPDPNPRIPVTTPGRIPNFPAKMFTILSRPELAHIVSWMPHGRSWKVHKPREFEIKVVPLYFEHNKFSSFIRQSNGWGFRRITSKGPDRNSYYHELFLRGLPHLLKNMKRPPPNSKPLADPRTEPDFYRIAEISPLPESKSDDFLEIFEKDTPSALAPCQNAGMPHFFYGKELKSDPNNLHVSASAMSKILTELGLDVSALEPHKVFSRGSTNQFQVPPKKSDPPTTHHLLGSNDSQNCTYPRLPSNGVHPSIRVFSEPLLEKTSPWFGSCLKQEQVFKG